MEIRAAIRRHPGVAAAVVVIGALVFAFGMWWFTPWRLFTDDRVNEAAPVTDAGPHPDASQQNPALFPMEEVGEDDGPRFEIIGGGRFISLEHESRGTARLLQDADGNRFLRFEDFETSNGPDLRVYLSAKAPSGTDDWHGYDEDFVDLGALKGNVGNQNYEISSDVDLDRYSTAVVWCRRFTVGFAAATLD